MCDADQKRGRGRPKGSKNKLGPKKAIQKTTERPVAHEAAVARSPSAVRVKAPITDKEWELSVTVSAGSEDLQEGVLERLHEFLAEKCLAGMFSLEKGGVCQHLHAQGVVRIVCKGAKSINTLLHSWLGWNDNKPSPGARIQCKALMNAGIHTWHGMLGYCSKDSNQGHFRSVMHEVSEDDLAIGGDEYLKHGAGPLKQRIGLDPGKIFDKALIFANMRMRGRSRPSLSCVLQQMISTGKYYPTAHWVTPTSGMGWDLERANAAWKMMLVPAETTLDDVNFVFGRRKDRYSAPPAPVNTLSDHAPLKQIGDNLENVREDAFFVDEPA